MNHPSEQRSLDELLRHANWMQALARSLVRDAAAADDLVQETLLRALKRPPRASESRSTRPWLSRVLHNVWREKGRQNQARVRREEAVAAVEALPAPQEQDERLACQREIAAAVQGLEEPFRSTLLWRYYDGLSSAEIGRRQGVPADRVRARLKRAKDLLRQRLQNEQAQDWVVRFSILFPITERPTASPTGIAAGASLGALMSSKSTLAVLAVLALTLTIALSKLHAPKADGVQALEVEPTAVTKGENSEQVPVAAPIAPGIRSAALLPPTTRSALGLAGLMAAPTTGSLSGIVTSEDSGAALRDARVVLRDNLNSVASWLETRSDSEGRFAFEDLTVDDYTLDVLAPHHIPSTVAPISIEAGVEHKVQVELRTGFGLDVHVLDDAGEALRGAEVRLIPGESSAGHGNSKEAILLRSAGGQTDATGTARVHPVEQGPYLAVVSAAGFSTSLSEVIVQSDQDRLEMTLLRPGSLTGTVQRADGSPAHGARLFVNASELIRTLSAFRYESNGVVVAQDGSYQIESLTAGEYFVAVIEPNGSGGFHMDRGQLAPVRIERAGATRLNLILPQPASVSGIVVDTAGLAVEGANVSISWSDYRAPGGNFFSLADAKDSIHHPIRTDADGRFLLPEVRVSWAPLKLRVRCAGFTSEEVALITQPGALLESRIELTRLDARLNGSLVDDDGNPVADQTMLAWEWHLGERGKLHLATSKPDGSFEFEVPSAVQGFQVSPRLRSRDPFVTSPEKRENIAPNSQGLDFVLHSKSVVEGQVVDAQGRMLPNFKVAFVDASSGKCDDQDRANLGTGRFRLYVHPTRARSAVFTAPGYAPTTLDSLTPASDLQVVLQAPPVLQGQVTDSSGTPVVGALVGLATLDGSSYPLGHAFAPKTHTDKAGTFRLAGVPTAVNGHLLVHPLTPSAQPLLHFSLPELIERADPAGRLRLVVPTSVAHDLVFTHAGGEPPTGRVVLIDSDGWPLDPRIEASFRRSAEVGNASRDELVNGRASFHLTPGDYHVVLIQSAQNQRAFPFHVAETQGETVFPLND